MPSPNVFLQILKYFYIFNTFRFITVGHPKTSSFTKLDFLCAEHKIFWKMSEANDTDPPLTFIVWPQNWDISRTIFLCAAQIKDSFTGFEWQES